MNHSVSGGPLSCFVEHMSLRTRVQHRDSGKLRYRKARHFLGGSFWWLVAFIGSAAQIAAAEQLEIQAHQPNANMQRRPAQVCGPQKKRSRTPQWFRNQHQAPPLQAAWESVAGQGSLAKLSSSSSPSNVSTVDSSSWSFAMAYRFAQRCNLASSNKMAAINIYAPRFASLLILRAASGNAVDWTLVEKHWKVV